MNAIKVVAIILVVAGIAGIIYGKFTYTKATHEATLGPVAVVGTGVMLLAVPKRT